MKELLKIDYYYFFMKVLFVEISMLKFSTKCIKHDSDVSMINIWTRASYGHNFKWQNELFSYLFFFEIINFHQKITVTTKL